MGFEIINKLKKEKGLTNAQLAKMSGVTLSTLDKITAGINTNPKLETLQALCRVLGCRLDDFVDTPGGDKNTPSISDEALKIARGYDTLDVHGQHMVRIVLEGEQQRMERSPTISIEQEASASNLIQIAARGGGITELYLTDEQVKELNDFIAQLSDSDTIDL